MHKELLNIDQKLSVVFAQLEHVLGVRLDAAETARVFTDAAGDQVSPKEYVFHQSKPISVTGNVDGYEPETIWLCVEGDGRLVAACAGILKDHEQAP